MRTLYSGYALCVSRPTPGCHAGSFAGDGLHALHFLDGLMILSDGQVETLGSVFSITDADAPEVAHRLETELAISKSTRGASIAKLLTHSAEARKKAGTLPQPCAWNMLLGRRYLPCQRSLLSAG